MQGIVYLLYNVIVSFFGSAGYVGLGVVTAEILHSRCVSTEPHFFNAKKCGVQITNL